MTEKQTKKWIEKINNMSHKEMARLLRFAPIGHAVFANDSYLTDLFHKRFQKFGGMTTEISKIIGWEEE